MNMPAIVPAVPQQYPIEQPEEFQLRGIITSLIRRRKLIGLVFLIGAGLTAAFLLLQQPKYQATSLVMIDPSQETALTPNQKLDNGKPDASAVDSQVEVLKSRAIAARLAESMKLQRDPKWNAAAAGVKRGSKVVPEGVIDKVEHSISAARRGLTHAVEVNVTAPEPGQAARMANTLVSLLAQMQIETQRNEAARADEWLEQRLFALRAEVREKEAAVEAYRAQHGLLTADGVTLTEKQIGDVQSSALQAKADLAEKSARYNQVQSMIRAGGTADSVAGVLNSDVIRDLRTKEADILRRQAEAEKKYGELHPALQSIRAERADIERQLDAQTQRILSSLKSEVDISRARVAAMDGSLAAAQGQLQINGDAQVTLSELERDAEAARAVFSSFLQRSHEISQQGSLADISIRPVSFATAPSAPSSPKLVPSIAIALAFGIAAGLLAALLAEHFDDAVSSADDIERATGLPAIASVPAAPKQALGLLGIRQRHPAAYLAEYPMSAFAEAFRVLRASIVYSPSKDVKKVVAVTSALPGEGKTTSALCLARIAALSGERVIIVDCDLRRRGLNDLLDIAPEFGLLEVLSGQYHWTAAVGTDEGSGAHVLAVRPSDFTPRDVFGSPAMKKLISELRGQYDMIVLDCAPILAVAETRALASLADTNILIANWRGTSKQALAAAIHQLELAGGRIGGVVVNRVNPRATGASSASDALYYSDVQKAYYHG